MIKVYEIKDYKSLYQAPQNLEHFQFEDKSTIKNYPFQLPDEITEEKSDIKKVICALEYLGKKQKECKFNTKMPESPEIILKRFQSKEHGHCYNISILFSCIMQKYGYFVRLVNIEGKNGLGSSGHTLTEVWIPSLSKWVLFDLQQVSYYQNTHGEYLSMYELRQHLIHKKEFQIQQATGYIVSIQKIPNFYRKNISDILYPTNNDLYTLENRSFVKHLLNQISLYAETKKSRNIQLLARFMSRITLSQSRYRLIDQHSSPSYTPTLWYYTFRLVLTVFIAINFYLAIYSVAIFFRRKEEHNV